MDRHTVGSSTIGMACGFPRKGDGADGPRGAGP